jgi:hypothetical protein
MPPQVGKAEAGPKVQQTPQSEILEDQSKDVAKSTSSEDPKATARAAQGSKQNAIEKMNQSNEQAQMIRNDLQKQVAGKNQNPGSVWENVKGAAQLASDVVNAGLRAIGNKASDVLLAELAERREKEIERKMSEMDKAKIGK